MNLAELIAREQIRDLVARYNSLGDAGDAQAVAQLFTEDGELKLGDASRSLVVRGREQIANLLVEIKASWSTGPQQRTDAYVRHYVSTHVIDLLDRHTARGAAHVLVLQPGRQPTSGRYFDRYRHDGDRWLFSGRHARADTRSAATATIQACLDKTAGHPGASKG